ncbi:PH domain-containing protein [Streptomyces sp. P9(2023)]|uniref:PH domain-containing protein n=1 Tax=Streptomyces sp. P9(2023) TaxID=3064394 RepID=UPI0028F4495B|nr:PH domain-containing protein [Streptomyces sp. P9(2023)]MDT9687746.1 PH domain-containing protein [Streptomyces sp. P9(2023)]
MSEEDWRRLDRRTVLVTAGVLVGVAGGAALPTFFGLTNSMSAPRAIGWILAGAALLVGGGSAADHVRWRRTRYRIGAERAELHTGLLLVKRRSLARERIRSVDLTANPLQRVLGLVKVRIGTGEHNGAGESTLELDPVARAEGERLRRVLLERTLSATEDTRHDGALAELDPRWIRYAPVSFVAVLFGGAAAGAVMQVSEWFGAQKEVIDWIGDRFQDTSIVSMILVLIALAVLVGTVGALALWVEMWWNYRLEREPGGTLRVRRGLFTARSISIEERRLRGVELVEPLGVRMVRAARVDAVATGLAEDDEDKHAENKTLLPAAPRAIADRVAAQVLREAEPPTGAPLTVHPRTARTRRLRWALWSVFGPVAVLVVLGVVLLTPVLLYVAAGCAVVLGPLAVVAATDAYRNLGHGVSGDYLVARSGTVRRTTVALERGGVIGWTVKQSYFQRRAGLLTLTATTAAGAGGYDVYDAGQGEGLTFAAEAVPDLLAPFLEPVRENAGGPVHRAVNRASLSVRQAFGGQAEAGGYSARGSSEAAAASSSHSVRERP